MIPGNVDPRRPDKVQRYKPAPSGNGNAPGEDLTPDYMNILGPDSTTGNVPGDNKANENVKNVEVKPSNPPQQIVQTRNDASRTKIDVAPTNTTSNASNVIPTSPQYGIAIIPSSVPHDVPSEANTPATDTVTESTPKIDENKDTHSTPSKNDRFKVVKIASSEPFRRGRWKCMDYVDQAPPTTSQQTKTSSQGSSTSIHMGGNVYMQTQSLPPHQIQQLLLQGALAAAPQAFYQGNIQAQVVPQAQYFYPAVQGQNQNVPQQIINPTVVPAVTLQQQFVNPNQQQYFQPAVIPQNFQGVQFVQPAYQSQNNTFVSTAQNAQNFQQSQSYTGQPNPTITQQSVQNQSGPVSSAHPQQPMVNGFAYSPQNVTDQQIAASNIPTQAAKNIILTSNPTVIPNPVVQSQPSVPPESQNQGTTRSQGADQKQFQQPPMNSVLPVNPLQNVVVLQQIDPNQPSDVYTNPQFVASVHNLPMIDPGEMQPSEGSSEIPTDSAGNPDDLAKTNPVVNAIDNKIEQAMDLVKSHLMYTVREEVEVLKEKIAELMERIQQLESENNFLRSQIPKSNLNSNGTSEPSPQQ